MQSLSWIYFFADKDAILSQIYLFADKDAILNLRQDVGRQQNVSAVLKKELNQTEEVLKNSKYFFFEKFLIQICLLSLNHPHCVRVFYSLKNYRDIIFA